MNANQQPEFIRLTDVPTLPILSRFSAGRPIHLATVYRWVQRGISGHRLQAVRVGGRGLATTEDWLIQFFASLGHVDRDPGQPTARQRLQSVERANRELEEAGI